MPILDIKFDDPENVVSGNIQTAIQVLDSLEDPTEIFNQVMSFSVASVQESTEISDPGMYLQGIATIIGLVMIRMAKSEELKRAKSSSHS